VGVALRARFLSLPLVLALLAGFVQAVPASVAASAAVSDSVSASDEFAANDFVSALAKAKSLAHKILLVPALTEVSTTWVNADGTSTVDVSGSPVRVRDSSGKYGWRDLDFDLIFTPDGVKATSGLLPLTLSEGGTASEVAATGLVWASNADGTRVGFGWDGALPTPVLVGGKATYSDVLPGVDLVVSLTANGFEQFFVLNKKPSSAVLDALKLPLQSTHVSVQKSGDGYQFLNAEGVSEASIGAVSVWDSASLGVTPADVTLPAVDSTGLPSAVVSNGGNQVLDLVTNNTFFDDPSLVYPVVIDPTVSLGASFDTYVQSDATSTDFSNSTELLVGTNNSGTSKYRSFLNFVGSDWAGTNIVSATLKLWLNYSPSCTPTPFTVYAAKPASSTTRWSSQPTIYTNYSGTANVAAGFSSSCPAAVVSIDVTSPIAAEAKSNWTTSGLVLSASETSNNGWKRFYSSNASLHRPQLTVTYNHPPAQPSAVVVANSRNVGDVLVSPSAKPTLSASATDADYDNVSVNFFYNDYSLSATNPTTVFLCAGATVASGVTASCVSTVSLTNGQSYTVFAVAADKYDVSSPSASTTLKVDTSIPLPPTINCPGYANNYYNPTPPAVDVSCTITPNGGTTASTLNIVVDGDQSNYVETFNQAVTVGLKTGTYQHQIVASTVASNGLLSDAATYTITFGVVGVITPMKATRTFNNVTLNVYAATQAGAISKSYLQWRLTGDIKWVTAVSSPPVTQVNGVQGVYGFTWDATTAKTTAYGVVLKPENTVLLQTQICFDYAFPTNSTSCTGDGSLQILRLGHAFGGNLPSTGAGPATVSLLSGEIQLSETDVNIATPAGSFTANRVYYSQNLASNQTSNGFGVGWVNSFTATDTGLTDVKVTDGVTFIDNRVDKVVKIEDIIGDVLTFQKTGTTFTALDDETTASGLGLTISPDGLTMTLTDAGGTKTFFTNTTPTTTATWVPSGVNEPGSLFATCYQNVSNKLTKLVQKLATNTTPCSTLYSGVSYTPDVRVMTITYASATTAASVTGQSTTTGLGDVAGFIKNISYQAFDPATNTYPIVVQSSYQYQQLDGMAVLITATDNRDNTSTTYTYKSVTPAGQTTKYPQLASAAQTGFAAYAFEYSNDGYLLHVLHQSPDSSSYLVENSFVYNTPTGATAVNAPDLSVTNTSKWGQNTAPVFSAIVFGADTPITTPIDGMQIASNTLSAAQLKAGAYIYTDVTGRVTNTAAYGLDSWLYTATLYNNQGLPETVFAARELAQLLKDLQTQPHLNPQDYATLNRYSPPIKPNLVPNDVRLVNLVDSWSPAINQTFTTTNGGILTGSWRVHTHNTYDVGAPNSNINPVTGKNYGYLTTQTHGWVAADQINLDPNGSVPSDVVNINQTDTAYDVQPGADTTVDASGSGWVFGTPTKETFKDKNSATTAITISYLNGQGQIVQSKGPLSSETENVADSARASYTIYYSAGVSPVTACQNKPAWVGLVCQQSTAPPTGATSHLVTTITAYTVNLQPQTVTETATSGASSATRTTQNSYTPAGLIDTTTVSGTGFTDNTTQSTHISYLTNGLPYQTTKTVAGVASSTSQTFDSWARQTSFTNSLGESATTTYKPYGALGAGLIATYNDPQNSYTYTYGGLDANNQTDTRSTLTNLTVNGETYKAAYDNFGALTTQNAPNGLTQNFNYDLQGRLVAMSYLGTTQDVNGNPVQQAWYNFARTFNENSQLATENKPTNAILGASATTVYSYDTKNHLTNAQTTNDAGAGCANNAYSFDIAGNRLTKTVTTGAAGVCESTPQTKTTSYNTYSQITDTGYVYDLFGRNTKIPAAATPTGASDLTLVYNLTNQVTNIAGVSSTNYSYDPNGNNLYEITTTGGVTTTTTKHYFGSDTPSFTTSVTNGVTTTEKYSPSLSSGLNSITTTTGGVTTTSVVFTDLQGANFATTTKPATGYATPPAGINTYDEYGNPTNTTQNIGTNQNYGWAGSAHRTTDKTGLILLGARVYNPASGQFTTTDPVPGGNENAYNYPNNPVNQNDFTGCWGNFGDWLDVGLTVAMVAIDCIPVVGEAAMLVETGYAIYRTTRTASVVVRVVARMAIKAIFGVSVRAATKKAVALGLKEISRSEIASSGTKSLLYIVRTKWGVYIGRTLVQGPERVAQHAGDFYKLTEKQIAGAKFFDTSGMSLQAQRKMEQLLINANGGVKALANRINSIASGFWEQLGIPKP
jgi:RHS repeat-associated protein